MIADSEYKGRRAPEVAGFRVTGSFRQASQGDTQTGLGRIGPKQWSKLNHWDFCFLEIVRHKGKRAPFWVLEYIIAYNVRLLV